MFYGAQAFCECYSWSGRSPAEKGIRVHRSPDRQQDQGISRLIFFSSLSPPHSRAFLLKEMEDAAAKVQLKPVKRRQRRLEFVSSARLKRQNKNCHSSFIVSIFFLYSAWRKLTGHNKYHFVTSALKETKPPLYCSSKSEFKTLRALIIYLALRDRNVMIDRDWTGKCHFL